MCHDHFTRDRAWDESLVESDERDDVNETTDADDPIPPLRADDEPDDDLEVLTDGGD